MRNRLDEIVEEETAGKLFNVVGKQSLAIVGDETRASIKRIAERAFRHGVEQAWADCKRMIDKEVPTTDDLIYKYSHKTPVSAVQPAPAGECLHINERGFRVFIAGCCIDRRKGERCPWTFAAQMPCDKPNGHDGAHGPAGEEKPRHIGVDAGGRTDYVPDRRSGKDRRKP